MNWVEQTISEFGNSIGLPSLTLDYTGKVRFSLQQGGSIAIQHLPDLALPEVVVTRSEPISYATPQLFRQALRIADFRNPSSWPLQAGCNQRELFLAMRIPERAFVMNVLEQALAQLTTLQNRIKQAK